MKKIANANMNTNNEYSEQMPLITPGEMLLEEYMEPLGITKYRLAKDIGVSATAIGEIISGKRGVTPDMARRLGAYLGLSARFWMNLQVSYELKKLDREGKAMPPIIPFAKQRPVVKSRKAAKAA